MTDGIDYFGRGHWLTGLQVRLSLRTRRKMFERWLRIARPQAGQKVIDIGTTPDHERLDSNCMIPWLLDAGLEVSLYSPEDISGLADVFPAARILPSSGFEEPIPVPDGSFDWAISSAVIEHTGDEPRQVAHLRECARVARGIFLATPNRAHWLEFHSKLPLVHWLPRPVHRRLLRAVGKAEWAREEHLRLLSRGDLTGLARRALGPDVSVAVSAVWALGLPSNLVLIAGHSPAQ